MFIDIILLCNHVLDLTSGAIRSSREKFRRVCLYTRKRLPRNGFVQTGLWEVIAMFPDECPRRRTYSNRAYWGGFARTRTTPSSF